MTLQERLDALLAIEHPDEVAELLREHDVKGYRESCWSCPLAKFLTAAADCKTATVNEAGLTAWPVEGESRSVKFDDGALHMFVRWFDGVERYQDLVIR